MFFYILSLCGCARSDDQTANQRYLNSVFAIVKQKTPSISIDYSTLASPKRRDIRIANSQGRINFREFFSLSNCQLNRLLGEHNSILNKHQDAVESLFYEIDFQILAAECIAKRRGEINTMYLRLEAISEYKASRMNAIFFNALFASREAKKFFSPYGNTYDLNDTTKSSSLNEAVNFLKEFSEKLLSGDKAMLLTISGSRSEFDKALGELARSQLAGMLLAEMAKQSKALQIAGEALEKSQIFSQPCIKTSEVSALMIRFENSVGRQHMHLEKNYGNIDVMRDLLNVAMPASHNYRKVYWNLHWDASPESASTRSRFLRTFKNHRSLLKRLRKHCKI